MELMGWFNVLKASDENLTQAVETIFSDFESDEDAEDFLIRLHGEEKIRPFIIAYKYKRREEGGHGTVTYDKGPYKKYTAQRGKKK